MSPDDEAMVARCELLKLIEELPAPVLRQASKAIRQVLREQIANDLEHVSDDQLHGMAVEAHTARQRKREDRKRGRG